jgi:hypothetical protein
LVDASGTAITGITPVAVTVINGSQLTIAADAFDNDGKESDSTTADRRLKLTYTSTATLTSSQLFTVSSPPVVSAAAATVYAGTGDGGAAGGTYTHSTGTGDISITAAATDMNGVATIDFLDTSGPTVMVGTTQLTPTDWTVDSAGDTITISKATLAAKGLLWHTPTSTTAIRGFRLTTAAGIIADSTAIITAP